MESGGSKRAMSSTRHGRLTTFTDPTSQKVEGFHVMGLLNLDPLKSLTAKLTIYH